MKKNKILLPFLLVGMVALASCGGSSSSTTANYNDGTYEGRSEDYTDSENNYASGYATCTITIASNVITACDITLYELDGTVKDENYGKDYSNDNYIKAQKAIQAADKYASSIIGTNTVDSVDCITGATITYTEFKQAVNNALEKAKA